MTRSTSRSVGKGTVDVTPTIPMKSPKRKSTTVKSKSVSIQASLPASEVIPQVSEVIPQVPQVIPQVPQVIPQVPQVIPQVSQVISSTGIPVHIQGTFNPLSSGVLGPNASNNVVPVTSVAPPPMLARADQIFHPPELYPFRPNIPSNLPSFDGLHESIGHVAFLGQLESAFQWNRVVTDRDKLLLVSNCLKGHAANWYFEEFKVQSGDAASGTVVSWESFKSAFVRRFGRQDSYAQALITRVSLRQIGPLEQYISEFQRNEAMILGTPESERVHYFIQGLESVEMRVYLQTNRVSDRQQAYEYARWYDSTILSRPQQSTLQIATIAAAPASSETQVAAPRRNASTTWSSKRMSDEERSRCMQKGLCFKCKKPGHQARNCTSL